VAKNAALRAARGRLVGFIDDDELADRRWMCELLAAARETDAAAIGGRIDLLWAAQRPSWLHERLLGYLGLVDYGSTRRVCHYPQYPFGGNTAFQRDTLLAAGGFNPLLGVGGYLMEDIEVCLRLETAGQTVVYTPAARVWHYVPRVRLTKQFLMQRAARAGQSAARLDQCGDGPPPRQWSLLKQLLCATGRISKHSVGAVVCEVAGRPHESFSEILHVIWNLAWAREATLAHRPPFGLT
jgi:hypothetical protein